MTTLTTRERMEEIISEIKRRGISYKEGAQLFSIPVNRIYEYNRRKNRRERKEREISLQEHVKNDADKEKSNRTPAVPQEIANLIIQFKTKHPDSGFRAIEQWLKKNYLVAVPRKKIRAVLKQAGLLEHDSSFIAVDKRQACRRFEALYPRELYQIDITYIYITGLPVLYLINIIDDYSRFCIHSELAHDMKSNTILDAFHNACSRYGKPDKVLTDQGKVFYSWGMSQTAFQQYCDTQKIEHIVAESHHPQTLGKVERFHQTIKRELIEKVRFSSYDEASRSIADYIHYYNYERAHQGIGGSSPSDRFHGVSGLIKRNESQLLSQELDLDHGYLILKIHGHSLAILFRSSGIQVTLDGVLLQPSVAERRE